MIENSEFRIEEPDLSSRYDTDLIRRFLGPLGFYFDESSVDYSVILYTLNDDIVGVGSCQGKVLKYVAVAPQFRESGAFAHIVTHLTEYVMQSHQQAFVFTRPENITRFCGIGYTHIASAEPLMAVLEFGYKSIKDYQQYLKSLKEESVLGETAAIVMNCNPFTLGHQFLIEKASAENGLVYLFVVEEDRSSFSFKDRWAMIEAGIAHLPNVKMVKGGEYVVSGATFPNYFLKNENPDVITQKQAELDIAIFCEHIAPVLGIQSRYVGTEDYCNTTAFYNKAMQLILPSKGISYTEVKRKEVELEGNAEYVSASKVRAFIKQNDEPRMRQFLPETTITYLREMGIERLQEKMMVTKSRH
ncbi:[citrate (pro-3S)-lyase] ligase [Carboxylicivirga sp. N1Y90]|uniref:[citrate (pro-3S)-lyase] ligase n=1 Tax=Carboxylicivirga fragile TaxID=3417571 RepID=UPI003D34743F|nr:[citrate (pro-3S)-lyase] ligase [Marinilabiliaceae bacterium N1Y90]